MATETNKLKPTALKTLGAGKHFDGAGLYLEVSPTGARYWRMKYRHAGREDRLAFGVFPEVSLQDARRKRDDARALLADGIDPKADRQEKAEARRRETEALFPAVAGEWLDFKKKGWAAETYRKAEYVTNAYLTPPLRKQSVATLSTRQAADVLQALADKAPALADKGRQYLQGIVAFAIRKGLRDDGRVLMLRGVLPKRSKGHIPAATTLKDVETVVRAVAAYPTEVTRAALQVAMLTAQRPGNIVKARWSDIDLEAGEWMLDGAEMKTRHAHVVPLSKQAAAALQAMQPYSGGKTYVFPPLARQKLPHLNRDTLSAALRDMGLQGIHATHGFRAMLRTMARERLSVDVDVLEAQLAHAKKGDVAKAYDRTQLLEQRREVMQEWADYLDRVREGKANVVPFQKKQKAA